MSLYGYPREPETPDVEAPAPPVPHQRVSSEPVRVPEQPVPPAADSYQAYQAYQANSAVPTGTASVATATVAPPEIKVSQPHSDSHPKPGSEPDREAEPGPKPSGQPAKPAAQTPWDAAILDEPEIAPWDHKPLMVVIAAGVVLVLIAVLSGFVSAAIFAPAQWRAPQADRNKPGASPGPAVPVPAQDTVSLSGVGDVIMGAVGYGTASPQGFFDPVKSALASDLVMGNLETALTEDTGVSKCGNPPAKDCFQLYLPPSYANPLRDGGFQLMNLANNHTNDMGPQGLANTRAALEAVGIKHTGAPGQITTVTIRGVKVAVLGFSTYSYGANLLNIPASADLVRQAAAQADLVVIQMQGGSEGVDKAHIRDQMEDLDGEPRGELIKFAHAVIDAGADVIFGHGPHVMRGMEFYKGRLIAYSLGNFCGYHVLASSGYSGVGGVLKVTLRKDGSWAGGSLIATQMINGGMVALDPDQRALAFVDGLSHSDFAATAAATISATDGTIAPPPSS